MALAACSRLPANYAGLAPNDQPMASARQLQAYLDALAIPVLVAMFAVLLAELFPMDTVADPLEMIGVFRWATGVVIAVVTLFLAAKASIRRLENEAPQC